MNTIQVKRGLFASLPVLAAGEFGFSTDSKQVHIGDGTANHELVTVDKFDAGTLLYAVSDNVPVVKTRAELMALLSGQSGADFAMNTHKITGVVDPTGNQDAATKAYVDAKSQGLILKDSSRVATAAALPACTAAGSGVGKTLTATAAGILTVDGVATILNDRILVKNQAAGADNGIYKVTTAGTATVAFILTRATDFDTNAKVKAGAFSFIEEGTVGDNQGWTLSTNNPITVDTTALAFTQFSGAGALTAGAGLTKTGDTLDVGAGTGITVNADSVEHTAHTGDVTGAAALSIANKITMTGTAPVSLSGSPTVIAAGAVAISMAAATASVNGYATAVQITKLDGIEALADVTDLANVTAAGAFLKDGSVDMTNEIHFAGSSGIHNALDTQFLYIHGGYNFGGQIVFHGSTHASYPGRILLTVPDAAGTADVDTISIAGMTATPIVKIHHGLNMNSKAITNAIIDCGAF